MPEKKRIRLAGLVVRVLIPPAAMGLALMQYAIGKEMYPATAIGTAGLLQVRAYCARLLLSHLLMVLSIPVLLWLYVLIFRAVDHKELFSKRTQAVLSCIAMAAYSLGYPWGFGFAQQAAANGYPSHPLLQAAMLWRDTGRDLQSQDAQTETDLLYLEHTGETCCIYDSTEHMLGQITDSDYGMLSQRMLWHLPHQIETYRHSGLVRSIDGDTEQPVIRIALEFDYDAGVLRRELLCEDEDTLPELRLWTTMDGEYAGGGRINGRTEIEFKPMVPGHAEAWVILCPTGQPSVVVSNVIVYDQTEYVD